MNKIQELNLELIKNASFNDFDGEKVVKDLLANKELWRGVVMDRGAYRALSNGEKGLEPVCLIKLRDIEDGYWNVDTLYILPVAGKEKELEMLAKTWAADEVDYLGEAQSGSLLGGSMKPANILRIWWD